MAEAKPPDDLIATMTDPRGRTVWLSKEGWDHIVEGHREVAQHLAELKKCVETAEKRTRGNYEGTEKLWTRNVGPSSWFCVVVRYEGQTGTVRTALAVKRGPPREGDLL